MAIEVLRPDASGDETAFHYNLGQGVKNPNYLKNFQCVDEVVADEDATYVIGDDYGPVWVRDLYNIPASSGSGIINKITVHIRCKSTTADFGVKVSIKSNSTVTDSAEKNVAVINTWEDFSQEWATNPADSAAWEWADIDALQIGVSGECQMALAKTTACTQVYVEVDYTTGPTPGWNKILYTGGTPTPNAWNQVKQEAGTGWRKLLYV